MQNGSAQSPLQASRPNGHQKTRNETLKDLELMLATIDRVRSSVHQIFRVISDGSRHDRQTLASIIIKNEIILGHGIRRVSECKALSTVWKGDDLTKKPSLLLEGGNAMLQDRLIDLWKWEQSTLERANGPIRRLNQAIEDSNTLGSPRKRRRMDHPFLTRDFVTQEMQIVTSESWLSYTPLVDTTNGTLNGIKVLCKDNFAAIISCVQVEGGKHCAELELINIFGPEEECDKWDRSRHAVFRRLTEIGLRELSCINARYSLGDTGESHHLREIVRWLGRYNNLFAVPCVVCGLILENGGKSTFYVPPLLRVMDSSGKWRAYHASCIDQ